MVRRFRIFGAFVFALYAASALAADLVYLNTPQGEERLISSKLREPFFAMQPYVETQQNLAFCGPASIVAVMNSLGTPRPAENRLYPYNFYTQDNIFNTDTQKVKSFGMVSVRSMALITASSQALLPLDLCRRWLRMVPSGPVRTSTSAVGLPAISSVNTMLGLTLARTLPP